MNINNDTKYKFRAECEADVQAVRAVLRPWKTTWKETNATVNHEGEMHVLPDVYVEFGIVSEGPTYGEILWLIDAICNCHVISDTLEKKSDYTGERKFRSQFTFPAERPDKEILHEALLAVRTRQQVMSWELERALQLHQTYAEANRQGEKWQPPSRDDESGGWIAILDHAATGLKSIKRISPPLGSKNSKKLADKLLKVRVTTLSA